MKIKETWFNMPYRVKMATGTLVFGVIVLLILWPAMLLLTGIMVGLVWSIVTVAEYLLDKHGKF